jgi:hypothetical protein
VLATVSLLSKVPPHTLRLRGKSSRFPSNLVALFAHGRASCDRSAVILGGMTD